MKPLILSVAFGALSLAAMAAPAVAQDVEIRNAVARVVVVPEDRADIAVEITGGAGLPRPTVERRGNEVRIDGNLGRDAVRNCQGGDGRQPWDGASVEVRRHGRINLADAPMIVLRTPRNVDVKAGGAVFGAVGRGARSVELGNGGCGAWTVANVDGRLEIAQGGSGAIRAGTSQDLEIALGGSGSVLAGATRDADIAIGGSGSVNLARADGAVSIAIGGSGDVLVRGGSARDLDVSIAGSGDIDFRGVVGNLDATVAGSGDVKVARVTGDMKRSIIGSGEVSVGGWDQAPARR
ncbi:MAG: hypothetical protein EON91_12555 [Brevundimonas sp.]|uniref:GIN domain-containing protein n=1 Tax=Brevundimonas sp. TaxID=1871086 RepID=UPI0012144A30|nr:DUF2807 domain-containing protein [Brevundimonas sp.]RZJ16598.1 MAG: hypothetical protein EON91_12555 [Brevundimonas sp.]